MISTSPCVMHGEVDGKQKKPNGPVVYYSIFGEEVMKGKIILLFSVLMGAIIMPDAWGGKEFPIEFERLVPNFKGASVFEINRTRSITRATFRTNAESITVFKFYMEALKKSGWKIESSNWDSNTGQGSINSRYEGKGSLEEERILNLKIAKHDTLKETEFVIKVEFMGGIE